MLGKLKSFVNMDALKAVYFAHILSHLSYGIIVLKHSGNVRKLSILQKRAMRTLFNVHYRIHCKPLFMDLVYFGMFTIYLNKH